MQIWIRECYGNCSYFHSWISTVLAKKMQIWIRECYGNCSYFHSKISTGQKNADLDPRVLWELFLLPLLDIYRTGQKNADPELRVLWELFFFPLLDIYWPKKCRSGSERAMKTVLFPTPRYLLAKKMQIRI